MHRLVCECPPLDVNSLYVYLLLSEHFSQTCIVSEDEHGLRAMVSAYVPPQCPEVLFVWQVAVAQRARGAGLAQRLIRALLTRAELQGIKYIETTVAPSNLASRRMFAGLARSLETHWGEQAHFDASLFGTSGHEAEPLLRIGPFDAHCVSNARCDEY
ncbi:diaminobutyrate acetyltransferase [Alcaligenaceae bacterium CGII-47]|nr:diaminobutyrate acetyltransferase [Alcaligenaceae bacterium CGII-47]